MVCFGHFSGRMTAVGFLFGPVSHVWYGYLDRWMPLANISTVLKKVLVDQAVGGPVFLAYFFAGKNFSHCCFWLIAISVEKLITARVARIYSFGLCVCVCPHAKN